MGLFLLWAATIVLDPGGAFRVSGWKGGNVLPADYPKLFSVYVEPRETDSPPLLGSYSMERGTLVFHPRFPLRPGLSYRAVFHSPGEPAVEQVFEIPLPPRAAETLVEQVYPTSTELPENILKFYIHFSAAMSRGEAYQHVRLIGEDGKQVDLPFLELTEELWDREARRFTLLFNPGRIKRGLVPHEELGPPVTAGKRYTLVIDAGWKDANGQPLGQEFRRTFHVLPAERRIVDLSSWKIAEPAAGTAQPLEVRFPRPMDRALLDHMIDVVGVEGAVAVDNAEQRWLFTPRAPWKAGSYELRVDMMLEDIAGNKVDRPFDVDVFEHIDRSIRQETKSLTFTVK
jgi:hypothetical protein